MNSLIFPRSFVAVILLVAALIITIINAGPSRAESNITDSAESVTSLPVGVDTFKIEINRDGIYELSYADLSAAGMNMATTNPNTLEMMYQGQPVAYQWVGNSDNTFDQNESVRFYGMAFAGSRHDQLYVDNNVYWIWAGGTPTKISSITNGSGYTPVTSSPASVTYQANNTFILTKTNQWATFPNEATPWFTDRLPNLTEKNYVITLPNPIAEGNAQFTVEMFTDFAIKGHELKATFNGTEKIGLWDDIKSYNIVGTIPEADLNADGNNKLILYGQTKQTQSDGTIVNPNDTFYLKRVTVDYQRALIAMENELIFNYTQAGQHEFNISGFTEGAIDNILVWDISNTENPKAISLATGDITQNGNYSYRVGVNNSADAQLIATTTSNLKEPVSIGKYVGNSLEPATNGAEWVAITPSEFRSQIDRLAAHRATTNGISTFVADVQDVINQYGYGLNTPGAIQAYLKHGYTTWTKKPQYLLLGGDATWNPLQRPCPLCSSSSTWNTTEVTWVVTDLVFEDRSSGLIPSDHTYALLNNDNLPDIAVGRLTGNSSTEIKNIVDKIMLYDQNVKSKASWMNNFLFIADNKDVGGDFCNANKTVVANNVPVPFNSSHYCVDEYVEQYSYTLPEASTKIRVDMLQSLNTTGAGITNYRGHGAITHWAAGMLSVQDAVNWTNIERPTVILSADCLDGNFAWAGQNALSETFLRLSRAGTAAHWSSTGLGYTNEHSILHSGFYDGLYKEGKKTIGDAIVYSKDNYINGGNDISEVYSFTLQGDPGMLMPTLNTPTEGGSKVYLPILVR